MSVDYSKTLKAFFDIEPSEIANALLPVDGKAGLLRAEIASLTKTPFDAKTPETEARIAHLWMVHANESCRNEAIPSELRTFYAWIGTCDIVNYVQNVAPGNGTLAKLSDLMRAIERREGMDDDGIFPNDCEPADYQQISSEWDKLLEKITDTIVVAVLRRYELDDTADLYEHDRVNFEIHCEIGRRIICSSNEDKASDKKRHDDYFQNKYGADALKQVQIRVAEIQEQRQ